MADGFIVDARRIFFGAKYCIEMKIKA